jgi:hypothetical protein
LYH